MNWHAFRLAGHAQRVRLVAGALGLGQRHIQLDPKLELYRPVNSIFHISISLTRFTRSGPVDSIGRATNGIDVEVGQVGPGGLLRGRVRRSGGGQ